jgi:hypothetical protein
VLQSRDAVGVVGKERLADAVGRQRDADVLFRSAWRVEPERVIELGPPVVDAVNLAFTRTARRRR